MLRYEVFTAVTMKNAEFRKQSFRNSVLPSSLEFRTMEEVQRSGSSEDLSDLQVHLVLPVAKETFTSNIAMHWLENIFYITGGKSV
jgi:hypothetical protein